MLPPFIIDQIRRREEEQARRSEEQQPVLELPLDRMPLRSPQAPEEEEAPQRGIVILDLA